MKLLLLLILPVSVVCQDSSIVKWNAKKKGKSPTDISFIITADIKKGYFIHPCEDCSFNDWNDPERPTEIDYLVDSNWTVKPVFSKNKYKQKTSFNKEKDTSGTTYNVDCRVYNKMKLFRGIELVPSEKAIAKYTATLTLKDDAKDKDHKKQEKMIKDAPKTLLNTLPPPDHVTLTINYKINNANSAQTVLSVPNTYKTKKKWGWKKTPRRIVNPEPDPASKTGDK